MFDLGWGELLVIGIVALIVVGPKDLPGMFRTLGRFTGKLRRMARDFQRAMDDAAKEAGVKDAANTLKGVTSPSKMGLDRLNEAAEKFEKWDPSKAAPKKPAPGPETQKLSEERAAAARKIHENAARKAEARIAAEKAAAGAEAPAAAAETPAKPARKPARKAAKPAAEPKPARAAGETKPARAAKASAKKAKSGDATE